MPETMSPREKVELKPCPFCGSEMHIRKGVNAYGHCKSDGCYANRGPIVPFDIPQQVASWNRRAALASSGDHAELARLAEAATKGPWVCKEGSTSYPECDDKDFWSVVLSPAGKEIVTLHERYASKSDDRGDYDFDAAFIAAANPATVLALIAEVAALRGGMKSLEIRRDFYKHNMQRADDRATEAERKLAEAVGLLRDAADGNPLNVDWGRIDAFLSSKEAERG